MIYSVWNPAQRGYDYYATSEVAPTHATAPPMRSIGLGAAADEAGWVLPSSARRVGQGEFPKGRIARRGGASPLAGLDELLHAGGNAVLYAGAVLLGYFFWRRS